MDFVNVAVRIRPPSNPSQNCIQFISSFPPVLYVTGRKQTLAFDNVFDENADQETVYQQMVKPLVDEVKAGYNCTVFAYGQTGTGKTYTMGSGVHVESAENTGFILRALDDFLFERDGGSYKETSVFVSFYEIYNEKVFDLLGNNNVPLLVREFRVQALTHTCVKNSYEAVNLLVRGSRNRHIGETKQNSGSSRSHAIFTIHCITKHEDHETTAKLNLVDLAGSENIKKTGNQGLQFSESVNINTGLLYIGRVMEALSSNQEYVPYRQCMITTVLQDSLNKKNYVTLIACVSPDLEDAHETAQTLDFASKAKRLKNKPELNKIVSQYKKENPQLFCSSVIGSAVKCTPRKRANILHDITPGRNKLSELNLNSLPVPVAESFKDWSNVSSSTTIASSTPWISCKENVPYFPMEQLEATISKIVCNQIKELQMSCLTISSSSPKNTARRVLDFEQSDTTSPKQHEIEGTFKIPELPKIRRSLRLSTKGNSRPSSASSSLEPNYRTRRRSTRLLEKAAEMERSLVSASELTVPVSVPRLSKKTTLLEQSVDAQPTRRRSVRFMQNASTAAAEKNVPVPAPRHKANNAATKDSLRSIHYNQVLDLLNNGTERQLQSLPTIGQKRAKLLYTYRTLNGKFVSISDLQNVPSWKGSLYQQFCRSNLIAD